MPFKVIYGVIGRSDKLNVALFYNIAHSKIFLFKFLFAKIPDLFGGFTVKNAFVSEIFFQFKVAPMIHRISDGFRKSLGKFLKFFAVGSFSGDVIFINSVGTHYTPFIMVAGKPELGNIFKMLVLKNFFRAYVAMVIYYRHFCRIAMIKFFCCFGG